MFVSQKYKKTYIMKTIIMITISHFRTARLHLVPIKVMGTLESFKFLAYQMMPNFSIIRKKKKERKKQSTQGTVASSD